MDQKILQIGNIFSPILCARISETQGKTMKKSDKALELELAESLEKEFGPAIDADEPISGTEAVDTICRLAPLWRSVLKKAEGPV